MMAEQTHKFLIDENLSRKLVYTLNESFPGSSHVGIAYLLESSDKEIWDFAKENDYCILTKDWDYSFMSSAYGCPPKVIRLNCGNKATAFISKILIDKCVLIRDFLKDEDLCYLEVE